MAKIALISPPFQNMGKVKNIREISPPLGILSLAAFLEKRGLSVDVYDLALGSEQMDLLFDSLEKSTYKVIGLTSTTSTLNSALSVAGNIKKRQKDAFLVFGGAHATVRPGDILNKDYVDCVIRGEGELSFYELCEYKIKGQNWKNAKGITFREGGGLKINPPPSYIRDLDSLPFPARHLVPFRKYGSTLVNYKRLPSTPVITARGCPFQCAFCSNPVHGSVFRYRSPENIIAELTELKEKYGVCDVVFWDDTFTADKPRIKKMCGLMKEKKINLSWSCATRVDTVDRDTLRLMKESGCWQISFGVESGADRLRKRIKKGISEKQILSAFRSCRKLGIETRAFFMLGIPSETRRESLQTIKFAKILDPDFVQFTLAVPYPGSQFFDEAVEKGWVPPDWDSFQTYPEDEPVYAPRGRSGRELLFFQAKAFKSFYLRPEYIVRRFAKIGNYREFKKYLRAFFNMLGW